MQSKLNAFIFSFSLFILGGELMAQEFERDIKQALKEKPKFEFRFDSRTSFINQTGVRVFGLKAGVQYDDKLSFGLGYNRLGSKVEKEILIDGVAFQSELRFNVISPYLEYVFYRDERWELSIPVQFSVGNSYYLNREDFGASKFNRQFVVSYEPAITVQYRLLKYFGLGVGVGYRLMLKPNTEVEEQFTSPVYIFKTKIYFQDLIKDLRAK